MSDSGAPRGVYGFFRNRYERTLENKTASNTAIIGLILLAAIPIIGVGVASEQAFAPQAVAVIQQPLNDLTAPISSVASIFVCAGNKVVKVLFGPGGVQLVLPDGRDIAIPETSVNDGAFYANSDQSFIFWMKGNIASIEEHAINTYNDCVLKQ